MRTNLPRMLVAFLKLLIGSVILLWERLTGKSDDGQNHQRDEHLQYFLPGQLAYYVEHGMALSATQIDQILALSRSTWQTETQQQLTFSVRRSVAFTGFTLLFVDVPNANNLAKLIPFLNQKLSQSSSLPGLRIEISPNWLFGSASHGPNPPSPGSWPVELLGSNQNNSIFSLIEDQPGKTRTENTVSLPLTNGTGANVHVAILDTAPDKLDLDEAYTRWRNSHDVVNRLLGNNSRLHIHRGIATVIELMDFSLAGHHYLMADHGWFVAGIVNSIAPEATLHLVRVFSPYGAATLETIAQGLDYLIQALDHPNDPALNPDDIKLPLIVNCSFGLSEDDGPDFPVELRGLRTSLRLMFENLTNRNDVVVVAAAGNDAMRLTKPATRFPAAFSNVISVGSLPKGYPSANGKFEVASYSNPAEYMTVGGEPGPGQGIVGGYVSELPVYAEGCLSFLWRKLTGRGLDGWAGPGHIPPIPPALTLDRFGYKNNKNGWAEWAGTSFSTPIITGFLATRWSDPAFSTRTLNFASARAELDKHIQRSSTVQGEKVIYIEQGT